MIVVPVKEGENIERALKKFKRKFERTGVVKELRARQQYNKPSVLKRLAKEHAVYVQQLRRRGLIKFFRLIIAQCVAVFFRLQRIFCEK